MLVHPIARIASLGVLVALLGPVGTAVPAEAQSYPSGMIRILGATAPGNPPDIVT